MFCKCGRDWVMTYGRSSGSEEDQRTEVSSALVGEGASGVDQSTNTVRLDGRADDGATPRGGGGGSLLAVEVLLLGVGLLRATVCVTEDGAENSQGDSVVEGRAESDGRGLDGGKVWSSGLAIVHCMTQLAQRCALAMMQVGSRSTYTTGRPLWRMWWIWGGKWEMEVA
jgi:hypothetical protein